MAKLVLYGDIKLLTSIQSLWRSRLKSTELTNDAPVSTPMIVKLQEPPIEEEETEEEQDGVAEEAKPKGKKKK